MSLNFMRTASVIAGPYGSEGVAVTTQRISFKVTKTDDPTANSLDVQVYNLAPDSAKLFETTDNSLTLQAGYAGSDLVLGRGDITRGTTVVRGPDRITIAECGDGLRTLSESRVSLSYDGAVSAEQIIGDVVQRMGLELRDTEADLSGRFRQGWAFVGPARDAMTSIAKRFGLSWSIQNNEVQVTEYRGTNTLDAVLISPDTGMIGSPEALDDDRDDTKAAKEAPGLRVTTLLNPLYEPGGIVVIRSRDYNDAEFRIKQVEHAGDTRGDVWHSVLEVIER